MDFRNTSFVIILLLLLTRVISEKFLLLLIYNSKAKSRILWCQLKILTTKLICSCFINIIRSSTFSRVINFFSNNPVHQKKSTYNLVDRTILFSHKHFHYNMKNVEKILRINDYPFVSIEQHKNSKTKSKIPGK